MDVVGFVDLGSTEHEIVALHAASGEVIGSWRIGNSTAAIQGVARHLHKLAGDGGRVRVGAERPDHAAVYGLLDAQVEVYSINPKQLARYREFLYNSGAKDDRRDAYAGACALRSTPEAFHRVDPGDPLVTTLRELSLHRTTLVKERDRAASRLREQVMRVNPELAGFDVTSDWMLRVLGAYPTPRFARSATLEELAPKLARVRKVTVPEFLELLHGPGVPMAAGLEKGVELRIRDLVATLELTKKMLRGCEKAIEGTLHALEEQQREELGDTARPTDSEILLNMPGVGQSTLAVVYSFTAVALKERDVDTIRTRGGAAPVSSLSGKRGKDEPKVSRRRSCNEHLRDALFQIAEGAKNNDPVFKAKYRGFRDKGHTHGRACRQLSDYFITVAVACLRNRAHYDVERLQKARAKRALPRPEA